VDAATLATGCQKGRVFQIVHPQPDGSDTALAYVVPATMLNELLMLEAVYYGVTRDDLLKDFEQLGCNTTVVASLSRAKILFVRDLIRTLHLNPARVTNMAGFAETSAKQLMQILLGLGARQETFFTTNDPDIPRYWLGVTVK
jgi:hypothetical protein